MCKKNDLQPNESYVLGINGFEKNVSILDTSINEDLYKYLIQKHIDKFEYVKCAEEAQLINVSLL